MGKQQVNKYKRKELERMKRDLILLPFNSDYSAPEYLGGQN